MSGVAETAGKSFCALKTLMPEAGRLLLLEAPDCLLELRATVEGGVVEVEDDIADLREVCFVAYLGHVETPRADDAGVFKGQIPWIGDVVCDVGEEEAWIVLAAAEGDFLGNRPVVIDEAGVGADGSFERSRSHQKPQVWRCGPDSRSLSKCP